MQTPELEAHILCGEGMKKWLAKEMDSLEAPVTGNVTGHRKAYLSPNAVHHGKPLESVRRLVGCHLNML